MKAFHRVLNPDNPPQKRESLCALAVMTKAPQAGKVKTRLTPPLSPEEAAALNTCFLRDTAASIINTAKNGPARGIGVYTPVGAEKAYRGILPDEFELVPQRGDAFGERLTFANEDLFRLGFDSVCLINSDSPTVPEKAFAEAVQILFNASEETVVLGPSDDGGYYLIGLKKLHPQLFERIDWSTERVLEQTIRRAEEINLRVHLLPKWYDVDDRQTLSRLCQELFGGTGSPSPGYAAPATRAFLDELFQREGRQRIWPNESRS